MASLRDLQRSFAAALRDPAVDCPVVPAANLAIYRGNAAHAFRATLGTSYPVLRQRVGDDYFGQLAHHYRARFPSRSGDLHHVGEQFAAFLDDYLRDGDYAWLADLARLEWQREEALIAAELPAVGAEVLTRFVPEQFEDLRFTLQPSLRLLSSEFPVFSVWLAHQAGSETPVDQSTGPERGLIRLRGDSLEVARLDPRLFSYLYAVAGGAALGAAMESAALDGEALTRALGFLFNEQLVTDVVLAS